MKPKWVRHPESQERISWRELCHPGLTDRWVHNEWTKELAQESVSHEKSVSFPLFLMIMWLRNSLHVAVVTSWKWLREGLIAESVDWNKTLGLWLWEAGSWEKYIFFSCFTLDWKIFIWLQRINKVSLILSFCFPELSFVWSFSCSVSY